MILDDLAEASIRVTWIRGFVFDKSLNDRVISRRRDS